MVNLSDAGQRFVRRLPVAFTIAIIVVCWILFVVFVSVKQVLLVRHETWRFLAQIFVMNVLGVLSMLSFFVAVARNPIAPDQSFAPPDARPLRPDDVRPAVQGSNRSPRRAAPNLSIDEDDIPLRVLRNARMDRQHAQSAELVRRDCEHDPAQDEDGAEDQALLTKDEQTEAHGGGNDGGDSPTVIMAKMGTGGPRWCRKCDGWKPDRCHHCRSCMQCVLKMDHHCPWLNNCVGYHNYKPFILFLTYCALFCAFGAWQAGFEVYRFFKNPIEFESPKNYATKMDEMDELRFALTPVVWMALSVLGAVFGLTVGGLGGYHWYLMLHNRTTLEDMNRSVPTALLDPNTRAVLEELGPRGTRQRVPGAWRPDHILTRPERTRLRSEAREINVYDVGWRRNLSSVMCGDGALPIYTLRDLVKEVARATWPLARPRYRHYGAGHFYEHDPAALQQLKALTSEMRLGVEAGPGAPAHAQPHHHLGEWTIGRSDSDSESESDE